MADDAQSPVDATRIAVRAGAADSGGLPAGTRLNGTYEIDLLIATGGMGEVYRGHVIETGDAVAIKVIRPDMVGNDAALALFRKEASALHHLNHAAIIRYFVVAIDPDLRRPYLAMEFVDGEPLSDILKRGPLPLPECLLLLDRLAAGLGAAHEIGIVHRDMSPDNVIVPAGDIRRAKIIDFGIAKSTRFGAETVIGDSFAGKFCYVSPEQLGLFGGDVTPKSDIYSLALVIAEAAGGKAIDMGSNHAETIDRRRVVPALDGVPPALAPLLAAMLQPLPDDRPASMVEVRTRAQAIGKPVALAAVSEIGQTSHPDQDERILPRRRRGQLGAIEAAQQTEPRRSRGLIVAAVAATLLAGAAIPAALFWLPNLTGRSGGTTDLDGDPYLPLPKPGLLSANKTTLQIKEPPPPDNPDTPEQAATGPGSTDPLPADPLPALPPPPVIGRPTLSTTTAVETPVPQPTLPRPPVTPEVVPPSPTVAMVTPPPPSPRAGSAEAFLARYPAMPCLAVSLRSAGPNKADIEAFGADSRLIEAFDTAFTAAMGFDANIQFRPVSVAQCPAVEFLRAIPGDQNQDAQLRFPTLNPKAGQSLEGVIAGVGFRTASAVLVNDDGVVEALPVQSRPGSRDSTITLPAIPAGRADKRARLVIVILSPQKPRSLQGRSRSYASEVFPDLAKDLAPEAGGVTIIRQYLRSEG